MGLNGLRLRSSGHLLGTTALLLDSYSVQWTPTGFYLNPIGSY